MATVIKGPTSILSGGGAQMLADAAKVGILKRKGKKPKKMDAAVVNKGKPARG